MGIADLSSRRLPIVVKSAGSRFAALFAGNEDGAPGYGPDRLMDGEGAVLV